METQYKIYFVSPNGNTARCWQEHLSKDEATMLMKEIRARAHEFPEAETFVLVRFLSSENKHVATIIMDAFKTFPSIGYASLKIQELCEVSEKIRNDVNLAA